MYGNSLVYKINVQDWSDYATLRSNNRSITIISDDTEQLILSIYSNCVNF